MKLLPAVKTYLGAVARFFLPWACAGCRTPLESIEDTGFCGSCWVAIPRIQGLVCQSCGIPLKDGGEHCFPCRERPLKLLTRAAAVYRPPLQPAIHRFKYAGRKSLQPLFKLLMEYAWNRYPELEPVDVLVPIPLHPAVAHDRGYNQSNLLALSLAGVTGRPLFKDVLVRARRTTPQFRLSKIRRLTNLQGAFAINPKSPAASLKGMHVLLIDDICTTGATLQECAAVLRQGGAKSVKALVLARDP